MKTLGEPWKRTDEGIENCDGEIVLGIEDCMGRITLDDHENTAPRIIACVNAMAGLDPAKVREVYEFVIDAHYAARQWDRDGGNIESAYGQMVHKFKLAADAALAARLPEEGEGNA